MSTMFLHISSLLITGKEINHWQANPVCKILESLFKRHHGEVQIRKTYRIERVFWNA